jgi:hypothetical protein
MKQMKKQRNLNSVLNTAHRIYHQKSCVKIEKPSKWIEMQYEKTASSEQQKHTKHSETALPERIQRRIHEMNRNMHNRGNERS